MMQSMMKVVYVFVFALTQCHAGPIGSDCAGHDQQDTKPEVNPLPAENIDSLKTRFEDVFPVLEKFHNQWKDVSDEARNEDCKKQQGRQGPQGSPGKPEEEPESELTEEQLDWFKSLGDKDTGKSVVVKRGFRFRREYRQLACWERNRFHQALWKMKTTMIGDLSEFDIFVQFHHPRSSPAAHGGAAFLPWHREYLWRFENALRQHDPRVYLPYWDSTLDSNLPTPADSIMWSDQFLGQNNGEVTTGPFSKWTAAGVCKRFGDQLIRRVGPIDRRALFNDEDISEILSKTTFKELNIPPEFEWKHGGGHVFVGGHMGMITCSPTDPIFWMHHSFIDHIWEEFRYKSQETNPEEEYPSNHEFPIGGPLHNPDAYMQPFDPLRNKDGLSNEYTNIFYKYMPRPTKCRYHRECGHYLFCHKRRCMSKVKVNGDCSGLIADSLIAPCECGICKREPGTSSYKCEPGHPWACLSSNLRICYDY